MGELDLQERFPEMQPVRSAPTLFRVNGFGLGMYGRRDDDRETGTFVKTQCVSMLWIPVLALRSYRVANADGGGWYFLGRVPLSGAAKLCNVLMLIAAIGLAGRAWRESYTSSPEYRAQELFAEGEARAEAGEYGRAARTWKRALLVSEAVRRDIGEAMRALLDREMDAAEAAEVYAVAVFFHQRPRGPVVAEDLGARGLARARGAADPRGALAILDAVAPVAPAEEAAQLRRATLGRILESEPDDLDAAVGLAAYAEAEGDADGCIALLERHRDRAAAGHPGETANEYVRILGLAYAARGRDEEALTLLEPFVEKRLRDLHQAQQAYEEAAQAAWDAEVRMLKAGLAPLELELRYEAAKSDEERDAVVNEYLSEKLAENGSVQSLWNDVEACAGVTPVALELGQLRFRRAQRLADGDARRAELEAAEATFLAIRMFAGDEDQYRLFLGQVRCWLGKNEEGHALFDELLATRSRAPEALLAVSSALRAVGAVSEARALAEEAWESEADRNLRHTAALQRAVMPKDLDDQILWLGRADPTSPQVQSSLAQCLGVRAERDGDYAAAEKHYREALDLLDRLPESSLRFNELALCWHLLYGVTGDRDALGRAAEFIERAIRLDPSDTIQRSNALNLCLEIALRDVVGDAIDLEAVRLDASFDALSFLYADDASWHGLTQRLLAHPRFQDAQAHLEKVVLMAPEQVWALELLAHIDSLAEDAEGLRRVAAHARERRLDLGDSKEKALARCRGEPVEGDRKAAEQSLARLRRAMEAARARGGATLALVAASLAGAILDGQAAGLYADVDEAVALADEAHAAAPSLGTRSAVMRARLHRTLRDLIAAHADEADRLAAEARVLGPGLLLVRLLREGGPLAQAALASKDLQRALDLSVEMQQAFPDDSSGWQWAFLSAGRPDAARTAAEALRKNALNPIAEEIRLALAPWDAGTAYYVYYRLVACGEAAAAREVLERCAAEGVPLPMPSR